MTKAVDLSFIASSISANSTASTINAASFTVSSNLVANTLGVYHTGTVNAASHTVGSSFIANTLGVYHTGTVNAASHTVGSSFIANSTVMSANGDLRINSGYGSAANAYGVRAWVNFDSTAGTPSIRGSGNITSITRVGTGVHKISFTNAMPDVNYCTLALSQYGICYTTSILGIPNTAFTSVALFNTTNASGVENSYVTVAVIR